DYVYGLAYGGLDGKWIDGGAGNDHIEGGGGNDYLSGGAGNDHIEGGGGNDGLDGGGGNDKLYGNQGRGPLSGGPGADYLNAGDKSWEGGINEPERLIGGAGVDTFVRHKRVFFADDPDVFVDYNSALDKVEKIWHA